MHHDALDAANVGATSGSGSHRGTPRQLLYSLISKSATAHPTTIPFSLIGEALAHVSKALPSDR